MNQQIKTAWRLMALMGMIFAAGCAASRPLQIEPVAGKGTVIQPNFENACYRYDADGTLYFAARRRTTDKTTGETVDQVVTMRVFWWPVGGKTSLDNTSLNATYRYVLITKHAVGMYEGAGFVRLSGKRGKKLQARLMDGDLRLTEASTSFTDTLGRSRMRGSFAAQYDDARAMDMLLQAHRDFFNRSLKLVPEGPRTGATTLGATTRPSTPGAATQEAIPMPDIDR